MKSSPRCCHYASLTWADPTRVMAAGLTDVTSCSIGQGTISVGRVGIILAWLAGFVALAALSVRSTAEKI
jgi:hypothetical protein